MSCTELVAPFSLSRRGGLIKEEKGVLPAEKLAGDDALLFLCHDRTRRRGIVYCESVKIVKDVLKPRTRKPGKRFFLRARASSAGGSPPSANSSVVGTVPRDPLNKEHVSPAGHAHRS